MRKIFFVIITLLANIALSQNSIHISGRVINKDTNIPISNASVYIKDKYIGTVSNSEGIFNLNIPAYAINDSIVISCMGYKKVTQGIGRFSYHNDNIIKLIPDIILLNEMIIIPSDSALNILENSLNIMISNLRTDPFEIEGFYREEIKQNNKYAGFSEASFFGHNEGYNLVFSKEKYKYFPPGWFIIDNIRVSDYSIIYDDKGFPRNNIQLNNILFYEQAFILRKLLSKKWRKTQIYKYKSIEYQNGETILVFYFQPKNSKNKKLTFSSGKIYLSSRDYRILRIEFYRLKNSIFKHPFTLFQKEILNHSLTFNFVSIDNKSYLSNCIEEKEYIAYKWDSLCKPDTIYTKIEFYINKIDATKYNDNKLQEKYGSSISYFDDIKYLTNSSINIKEFNYNQSFWDNYPQSSTNTNWDKLNRDLSKTDKSLLNQFIENKGQIILSEESIHYLFKHYNKKSSTYAKSYNSYLLNIK